MYDTKFVKYNPSNQVDEIGLVPGKIYEVIGEEISKWRTFYTLRGVDGNFPSSLFSKIPVHMGVAKNRPVVGERLFCSKMVLDNGKIIFTGTRTSTVEESILLGGNVYQIITKNSVYIVTGEFW